QCLRNWARDYITKPFSHNEFIVKAKKILEGPTFFNQAFSFCPLSMRVKRGAKDSETLTAHEARLFNYLSVRPYFEAKKDELMMSVWAEDRESGKLVVTVARLRKKI